MSRPLQRGLGVSQRPFAERFRGASPQLWRCLSSRDGGKASTRSGAPVLLPKTKLPMRANAAVRELEAVEDTTEKLYSWQRERRSDSRDFILHDGPPYANGDLHTGHFLNKCLKDFINRFQLLKGRRVHYVPGWDCHGLPIELKALSKKSAKGTRDPKVIRELARKCAEDAIASQKAGFKRWGVMANWDSKTYATFDKSYEAAQLDVFGQLVKRGFVRRGLKPVYWSYSSRTALAEAEIEYQDAFESPSCFVDFEITGLPGHEGKGELTQGMALVKHLIEENRLRTTAWTTTPWTLLSNVALAVQPTVEYSLVTSGDAHPVRLLASERLEDPTVKDFFAREGGDMVVLGTVLGRELYGIAYKHPLQSTEDGNGPGFHIILGDHVTTDSGTGVVHTAPSHGQDDFIAWKNDGGSLEECPCPIDDSGSFFKEIPEDGARARIGCDALWESLSGLHIHKGGNEAVLDLLEKAGALPVPSTPHVHRYPIDWRTKKPVITRATEQWFVNLSALKGLASEALEEVELVPASSRARLGSMVQGRDEWCISRQRVWGVPIPALYASSGTAKVWMDEFLVEAAREVVAEDGTDAWFASPSPAFETQLAERANALRAAAGLKEIELEDGASWQRGTDTLDVWFDSGSSWRAVLSETLSEGEDVAKLCADVYLEGSDQHRGWFQSSLLTKVASTFKEGVAARAPFGTIITHGFVLDEKDQKMSKSLGNTIVPDDVIHGKGSFKGQAAYGVDVLRLWAASTDFSRDVPLSKAVVKDASDDVRKIRNVARFLLGNLHDFDPSKHSSVDELDVTKFNPLDRYMLDKTNRFVSAADAAYSSFHFRGVFSELMRFVSNDVSALYSTAAKDRLYCDPRDDLSRRQCQAVLWEILQAVTVVAAPILCYTAEEIHRFALDEVGPFPSKWRSDSDQVFSVFQASFPKQNSKWLLSEQEAASWERLLHVRRAVNKLIGDQERSGVITSSEQVVINVTPMTGEDFHWFTESKGLGQTLVSLTNVADCVFSPAIDGASDPVASPSTTVVEQGLGLSVEKTTFDRCSRCRRHTVPPNSGDVAGDASLCPRCSSVGLDQ